MPKRSNALSMVDGLNGLNGQNVMVEIDFRGDTATSQNHMVSTVGVMVKRDKGRNVNEAKTGCKILHLHICLLIRFYLLGFFDRCDLIVLVSVLVVVFFA